jgi:hypothetical protein
MNEQRTTRTRVPSLREVRAAGDEGLDIDRYNRPVKDEEREQDHGEERD